MTPDIRRTRSSCWSYAHLATAFNIITSGEFAPSDDWTARWIQRNDISLHDSVSWQDPEQYILGHCLLAIRGNKAWVGAMGLAPQIRGLGLSHQLLRETLEPAQRRHALRRVTLEVAQENAPARKVYEAAGFRITRPLHIMNCPQSVLDQAPTIDAEPLDPASLPVTAGLPWHRRVRPETTQAIQWNDQWAKYRIDDQKITLVDTNSPHQVTAALHTRHPNCSLTLMNEPPTTPLHSALIEQGWIVTIPQYEMRQIPS